MHPEHLSAAEARFQSIIARLEDRLIRAPFAGMLGFREVSEGTLVTPGSPITTLDDVSLIKLDFSIPEVHLNLVRPGLTLTAEQQLLVRLGVFPTGADLDRIITVTGADPSSEWASLVSGADSSPAGVDVDPLDPAGIAYTSGTAGFPKGVVHSHHGLLVAGAGLVAGRGYGPALRKGDCLPLTILNIIVLSSLTAAQAGGSMVAIDRLDPAGIAEWIRAERVTTFNAVPTILHGLLDDPAVRKQAEMLEHHAHSVSAQLG